MNPAYSADDILKCWDQCVGKHKFVILDGGEEIPADVRMTAYRDATRWAAVFEELMFYPASPGPQGIINLLYKSGNCLANTTRCFLTDRVSVTTNMPHDPVFLPPVGIQVNREAHAIKIRDRVVAIDLSDEALKQRYITTAESGALRGQHVLWSLLPEHRELLLANEDEKRENLPADLPFFAKLDERHHPLFLTERLRPSQSETFQLLAEAIASGDMSKYKPTASPNTHWRNWLGYERI